MKARLILLLLCLGMFCFLQSSFMGYAQNGENIPQEPQKITPASKQMQTLEEKLDLILEQYSELKATDKELEQEVKETFRDNTSYISLGMTTLGVFAGALALIGIFITVMTYFNSKNHLREIKEVRDKAVKYDSDLEQVFLKQPMSEKIDKSLLKEATEKVRDITADGRDTLLALAIHSLELEEWEDSYCFWKALSRIDRNDNVLFYYALSCVELFKSRGKERFDIYLLNEAHSCFATISDITSNSGGLVNWGVVLSDKALISIDVKNKKQFWKEAEQKYVAALKINPSEAGAWNNWGLLLFEQAKFAKTIRDQMTLLNEAEHKYFEAIRCNLNLSAAWKNFGILLSKKADLVEGLDVKIKFLRESAKKYSEVVRINPNEFEAWNNWGAVLDKEAIFSEKISKKRELWNESLQKYLKALNLKPNSTEILDNIAMIYLKLADTSDINEERSDFLTRAELELKRAILLNPNNSTCYFNLACIESRRGNLKESLVFLQRCKELKHDQLREKIINDRDFNAFQTHVAFQGFLKSLI